MAVDSHYPLYFSFVVILLPFAVKHAVESLSLLLCSLRISTQLWIKNLDCEDSPWFRNMQLVMEI